VEQTAHIHLKNSSAEIQFTWTDFDGDDCFERFFIIVTEGSAGETKRFEFGPCVVVGLRQVVRFFRDPSIPTVGGGFRHPDIRLYDVYRSNDGYRLVIHFEALA
jgi:hypothetical protein